MPSPKKGARLGGSPAHQKLILANLATSLFEHGRITTTEAKARVLRPVAERLITKAKKGDLHNRRQVLSTLKDKGVVHSLFEDIAPRFAERPGGYTRITKLGPRKGDNAPMAVIELVTEEYVAKPSADKPSADKPATSKRAKSGSAKSGSAKSGAAKSGAATSGDAAQDAPVAEPDVENEVAAAEAPAAEAADETPAAETEAEATAEKTEDEDDSEKK